VPVDAIAGCSTATPIGGTTRGVLLLAIGLGLIFLALGLITKNMRSSSPAASSAR
jgi:hypothetical protein